MQPGMHSGFTNKNGLCKLVGRGRTVYTRLWSALSSGAHRAHSAAKASTLWIAAQRARIVRLGRFNRLTTHQVIHAIFVLQVGRLQTSKATAQLVPQGNTRTKTALTPVSPARSVAKANTLPTASLLARLVRQGSFKSWMRPSSTPASFVLLGQSLWTSKAPVPHAQEAHTNHRIHWRVRIA